jgi:RND family efflux transporter MFP subunit
MSFIRRFWLQYIKPSLLFLRRHLKASIAVLLVVLIAWAVYAVTRPSKPVFVTAVATKGDLRQTVEAVGTIISEKDLALQFPTLDVVSAVFVKEGDKVVAGQRLATLRSGSLSASLSSASASVQSAQAALQALEEGSRPEDIAVAEASVANKRASLEAAKQTLTNAEENLKTSQAKLDVLKTEAETSLSGLVATAGSTMSQQLALSKTALLSIRGVFSANDVNDAIIKNSTAGYDFLTANLQTALTEIESQQTIGSPQNYQDALAKYSRSRTTIAASADIASRAYDIIATLPLTSYFTNTSKETNKSTIATQKSYAQAALTSIDAAANTLQDASATYDTRIASQQSEIVSYQGTRDRAKSDILTYETSLQIDQAQLDLKKAPARQTDLDAARARVRQAQADWSRASSQLRDTVLVAPVDGIVTKVNVKTGEIRPSTEASVAMLGTSPYRIEMFVSEVDISRVQIGQTGSVTLDAFHSTPFMLRVSEIDAAASDKDGVPKYRVKLDFSGTHESLKVGMTGDAVIITGQRTNVISVPIRSVVEREDGTLFVRVITDTSATDYDEQTVETGMEGEGGLVEVSNIKEGDTVIVLIKS